MPRLPPAPPPTPAGDCRGSRAPALGAWELPATLFVLGCLGRAATLRQLQCTPARSPSVKGRNCSRDLCFPCQRCFRQVLLPPFPKDQVLLGSHCHRGRRNHLGSRGEPATSSLAGKCETLCPSVPTSEPAAGQCPFLTPISLHHLPGPHSSVPPGPSIRPSPGSEALAFWINQAPQPKETPHPPRVRHPLLPAPAPPCPERVFPVLVSVGGPPLGLYTVGNAFSTKSVSLGLSLLLPAVMWPAHCPCSGVAGGPRA